VRVDHDQIFRIVLIAVTAVVMPIGLYHRIKSQAVGDKLDRRQEGLFILATLRPIGVLLMLSVIAYMVSPRSMAWSSLPLPVWLRCMGVALACVAAGLLTWTFRSIGTNITDTVATRRNHVLITHGPYRFVRHPFYGSVALCVLGIALMASNWFILLGGAAVLSLLVVRTRKEEENLVARFGDAYRVYMNTTGRFFPRHQRSKR
jgi:protein-S-isoprenylcysteine O-methyltransferase Ste14